jgi:hypothetical protein
VEIIIRLHNFKHRQTQISDCTAQEKYILSYNIHIARVHDACYHIMQYVYRNIKINIMRSYRVTSIYYNVINNDNNNCAESSYYYYY